MPVHDQDVSENGFGEGFYYKILYVINISYQKVADFRYRSFLFPRNCKIIIKHILVKGWV